MASAASCVRSISGSSSASSSYRAAAAAPSVSAAQRPLELRGRFPVRGQSGRPPRRRRGVAQHRRGVVGSLGVEGQLGVVPRPGRAERGEDLAVDRRGAARRDGLLHRQPGDLVPEPQPSAIGGEQPAGQQLVDGRRRAAGGRLEQPRLHPGAGQRGDLEQLPGVALRPAARASTASRAEAGTFAIPACRTSVT